MVLLHTHLVGPSQFHVSVTPFPLPSVGVYGTIPQSLLDQEDDLIRKLYQTSPDLHDLKRVSENSQKQYVRSRSQAAPESVKRAKKLLSPLPLHPMFEELCSTGEKEQCQLLNSLKCYKPSQVLPYNNPLTVSSANMHVFCSADNI